MFVPICYVTGQNPVAGISGNCSLPTYRPERLEWSDEECWDDDNEVTGKAAFIHTFWMLPNS